MRLRVHGIELKLVTRQIKTILISPRATFRERAADRILRVRFLTLYGRGYRSTTPSLNDFVTHSKFFDSSF
jgi:hypothetical protein